MPNIIKHIIWDVSGTLWDDSEQVFQANFNILKNQYNIDKTPCGQDLTINWLKSNAKGSCVEMFRYFNIKGTDEFLDGLYKESLDQTSKVFPPIFYSGVLEMLNILKNRNSSVMSVISAHPQKRLDEDFRNFKISDLFNSVSGSCHNKTSFIENAINKFSFNQDETVYIGDTQSDMEAANTANIIPIGVSYGYQKKQQVLLGNPKRLFPNVNLLSKYLLKRV